jgi:hypothetical protein
LGVSYFFAGAGLSLHPPDLCHPTRLSSFLFILGAEVTNLKSLKTQGSLVLPHRSNALLSSIDKVEIGDEEIETGCVP